MNARSFYKFSGPAIAIMIALLVFPLILACWFSLHYMTYSNLNSPSFVGLDNYGQVLRDPRFWDAARWTGIIIIVSVPVSMLLGLVMALLVDQLNGFLRTVIVTGYLLPMLVVPILGAAVFKKLIDPGGILSWLYRQLFDDSLALSQGSMKLLILGNTVWLIAPFTFIILFAGLQSISAELSEAALIDGSNRLQHIRYIVLPHLRTLLILTGLINVMDTFRLFDNIFVLTGMNPVYQADSLMTYAYRTAFDVRLLGLGNAMTIVTVVGIIIVLVPFLYLTHREQRIAQ